jgi:phosphatidylglycerophosphatase A
MRIKEFFFTGFYSGYFPVAPGTAGTAVAMVLYILENIFFPGLHWAVNLAVVLVLLYPSMRICGAGELFFASKDPGSVVWDEIIGYWVGMLFLPYSWKMAVAGFLVFRFMDIVKPFPAGALQRLKGGLGILVDDIVAGIYTCLLLHGLLALLNFFGINFFYS